MKKALKILGIVLAVLVGAVVSVPLFFADDVEAFAKQTVNGYVRDANVDFGDFSLSVLSSFPSLQAGVDDVTIVGRDRWEGDTLLHVGKLRADLDLVSALKGVVKVKGVLLDDVLLQGLVAADSAANWDIVALPGDSTAADTAAVDPDAPPLKLSLEDLALSRCRLVYRDSTLGVAAAINDLSVNAQGGMVGNVMGVGLTLAAPSVNAAYGSTQYVRDAALDFNARVLADLDSMKFRFQENRLTFAGLPLAFDGWLQLRDSSTVDMDMRLAALETQFKTLLDLVPDDILKRVDGLEATGSFELKAEAVGSLVMPDSLPRLDAALKVMDGHIKYPDLPKSVDHINIGVAAHNPGGPIDATTVAVDTLHVEMGGNPFDVTARLRTPLSNPAFGARLLGKLDLGSVKDALPLENLTMGGTVDADLKVGADLESLEKEHYDKVYAAGQVALNKFVLQGAALPMGLDIARAKLAFSPRTINLNPLEVTLGKSDISLTGNVENYLHWLLGRGALTGRAALRSSRIDANELLTLGSGDTAGAAADGAAEATPTAAAEPLKLPENIDFRFDTNIGSVLYDRLTLTNTTGSVTLREGVAKLNDLTTRACDGQLTVNGDLSTPERQNAKADLRVEMKGVDVNKLAGSFSIVDSMMPIMQNAHGAVNISLDVTTELDRDLSMVMKTVNGKAKFTSRNIELKDSKFQQTLSKIMSNEKYNDLNIKDCTIKCLIESGSVVVDPFDMKLLGKTATFGGRQGLDASMDYLLKFPVERKEIMDLIGKTGLNVGKFATEGSDLPIGVAIKGVLSKPELKLDFSDALDVLKKDALGRASEEAEKLSGKADEAIDKIKDENLKKSVTNLKKGLDSFLKKKK